MLLSGLFNNKYTATVNLHSHWSKPARGSLIWPIRRKPKDFFWTKKRRQCQLNIEYWNIVENPADDETKTEVFGSFVIEETTKMFSSDSRITDYSSWRPYRIKIWFILYSRDDFWFLLHYGLLPISPLKRLSAICG